MPSGQRKTALGVIEGCRLPGRGAVTDRAVCGKPCRHVVRIRRVAVVLQMAAHASIAGQAVVPVDMAIAALQLGMRARDGETHGSVVKIRGLPCGRGVAVLTCLREPERDVIRISSLAEIRQVAAHTGGWRSLVLAAHVAT
jgi:hypothetical protein